MTPMMLLRSNRTGLLSLALLLGFIGIHSPVQALSQQTNAGVKPSNPSAPKPAKQDLTPPPAGYLDFETMQAELEELAKTYGRIELYPIAQSPGGRPIYLTTFRTKEFGPLKPEALIVANLEGDKAIATEVAMGMIRYFSSKSSPWGNAGTIHIIPCANPDAYAEAMAGRYPGRGAPIDEDRDGRADENGPSDLDGDGKIMWIREPSVAGGWYANPDDPRASDPIDAKRDRAGEFNLRREGWDEDGDRLHMEDPLGGIRVDSNFPHLWQQYSVEAGPYPLSEVESKTLADFVISREKLAWVMILDNEDNLVELPKGVEKVDIHSTEFLSEDTDVLKAWSKRLYPGRKKAQPAKRGNYPKSAPAGKGTFADWVYYQRGLFVIESAIWTMDQKAPKARESADSLRLAWADRMYSNGAFRDWYDFDHPEMGLIQIGGWMPLVQHNPPSEWVPDLSERYRRLVEAMSADFAELQWAEVEVRPLDYKNIVEVRAKLINVGRLPTTTAMGKKTRTSLPVQVHLRVPEGSRILVGKGHATVARIQGNGGFETFRWILQMPDSGPAPSLFAECATAGKATHVLE